MSEFDQNQYSEQFNEPPKETIKDIIIDSLKRNGFLFLMSTLTDIISRLKNKH